MRNEALELAQQAAFELKTLRKQNEIMSARLDMFDKCMLMLNSQLNYPGQGMSEDIVWKIEKYTESLNNQ